VLVLVRYDTSCDGGDDGWVGVSCGHGTVRVVRKCIISAVIRLGLCDAVQP